MSIYEKAKEVIELAKDKANLGGVYSEQPLDGAYWLAGREVRRAMICEAVIVKEKLVEDLTPADKEEMKRHWTFCGITFLPSFLVPQNEAHLFTKYGSLVGKVTVD